MMNRGQFWISEDQKGWAIQYGCNPIVTCCSGQDVIGLRVNGRGIPMIVTHIEEAEGQLVVAYEGAKWQMEDRIQGLEDGFYEIHRSYTNNTGNKQDVVLQLDMKTHFEPAFYMIPAVSYMGNKWGNGKEPKGLSCEGIPWVFAYNRTSLPSATFSENDEVSFGLLSAIEEDSRSSACSLIQQPHGMIHRIMWPEIEAPYTYASRDRYEEAIHNTLTLEDKQTIQVKAYFSINQVEHANYGWTKAYDKTWDQYKVMEEMRYTPEEVWGLGMDYIRALLEEDGEALLLNIGYAPSQGQWALRKTGKFEIGWCGQHGSLGTALIRDYLIYGNRESLELGERLLDAWAKRGTASTGLFTVQYDRSFYEDANPIADTCNLAWGAWFFMEAYGLAEEAGLHKSEWLEMARGVCDFFVEHYSSDFYFGKTWDIITDKVVDEGGSIGAFLTIPLIKAYKVLGDKKYLDTAIKAYKAYATRDLDQMQCTAGALDTCCVDKETCWPFLKAGLDLYEITGEGYFLEEAKKAGYYILSWMMHYETVDPKEENDFKRYGYKTFGGTAVSAQHHHLDPWGGLIAYDWMRLGKVTGNDKWLERARATWQNALYGIADGVEAIHGLVRPRGSQNEAYFHCNWSFHMDMEEADRMNDWLVAWPSAFRLVTLMETDNWDLWR